MLVLVPRLVMGFRGDWGDTSITLPQGKWHSAFGGSHHSGGETRVSDLLKDFPVRAFGQEIETKMHNFQVWAPACDIDGGANRRQELRHAGWGARLVASLHSRSKRRVPITSLSLMAAIRNPIQGPLGSRKV